MGVACKSSIRYPPHSGEENERLLWLLVTGQLAGCSLVESLSLRDSQAGILQIVDISLPCRSYGINIFKQRDELMNIVEMHAVITVYCRLSMFENLDVFCRIFLYLVK